MGERNYDRQSIEWRTALAVVGLMLTLACATSPGGSPGGGASDPGEVGSPDGSAAASMAPAEIRAVELAEHGETASVRIAADRALVWTNYRDRDGNLILEISNAVAAEPVASSLSGQGLVESVAIERLTDTERPMTRFVVQTRRDSELALDSDGSTLVLELTPVGYEEPVALAYEPIAEEPAPPVSDPATVSAPSERAATGAAVAGTPEQPYVAPAPRGVAASRLLDVAVHESSEGTVIEIAGDGEFAYSSFQLQNPDRFVIDLGGVVNTSRSSTLPVRGDGAVEQVRVAQFKPRPDPVSRVVFDLSSAATPRIERTADGLVVSFDVAGTAVASAPSPPPMPRAEAAVADASPAETYSAEDEVADDFAADEPEASPYDIEPTTEQTVVAESTVAAREEADTAPPADAAPVTAAPATAPPVTVPPVTAAPVVADRAASEPIETADEVDGENIPLYDEEPYEEEPPVVAAAPPPVPVYQPEPRPAPPSVSRPAATSDVALFEAQDVALQPAPTMTEEEVLPQFDTLVVSRSDRQYVGEPISMSLRDADLVETLRSFAKFSDLNFVIQPDVSGTVTVELNAVPWDQALEQILKINRLGMDIDGTIVRIAGLGQLQEEAEQQRRIQASRQEAVPLRTVMKRLSYARASEVAGLLQNRQGSILSARGAVQVDQRTNTLLIRELPSNIDTVLAVLENLDIPEPQVMIEARVIEATKTFSRSLGIEWSYDAVADQAHGNTTGLVFPNSIETDGGVGLLTGGANGFLNLSLGNILDTFNLDARLQAAEAEGLVNVVSAPRVTTLNNTSASIQSGLQIPIQTVTNRTVSVQFVNATLQLQVTPQVTAEGTVVLTINVAKKSPQFALAIVGASSAPIATKEASTTVVVRDGATTVIGGIYEVSANQGQDRVPGLANIPILGHLFKNRSREDSNDELMIFITPRIVQM